MRTLLPACVALLAIANPSRAGVPDPNRCTVPATVTFCPAGDLAVTIVTRDFSNNPRAGDNVVLVFAECSNYHFCAQPLPNPAITFSPPSSFSGTTQSNGGVSIPVAMTGGCATTGDRVQVYSEGIVLFPTVPGMPWGSFVAFSSPDQNGDFTVDAADEAILTAKIAAATDRTADLDGNGTINNADLDVLHAHLGHTCDSPVPTRRTRWGQLKLLYR